MKLLVDNPLIMKKCNISANKDDNIPLRKQPLRTKIWIQLFNLQLRDIYRDMTMIVKLMNTSNCDTQNYGSNYGFLVFLQ